MKVRVPIDVNEGLLTGIDRSLSYTDGPNVGRGYPNKLGFYNNVYYGAESGTGEPPPLSDPLPSSGVYSRVRRVRFSR